MINTDYTISNAHRGQGLASFKRTCFNNFHIISYRNRSKIRVFTKCIDFNAFHSFGYRRRNNISSTCNSHTIFHKNTICIGIYNSSTKKIFIIGSTTAIIYTIFRSKIATIKCPISNARYAIRDSHRGQRRAIFESTPSNTNYVVRDSNRLKFIHITTYIRWYILYIIAKNKRSHWAI